MSLTLRVSHGFAVDVHGGLNARVAHQLSLHAERRPGFVQPGPIAVPKRVPADAGSDSGCNSGLANMVLLDFLLMIGFTCGWIGKQPAFRGRQAPLSMVQQRFDEC